MKASVIIPNYNGMKYLDGVLGSLEKQTMKEFEVILVDNGSVDESISYVRENYSWVQVLPLEKNYGFCHAVNEGIKNAAAPYLLLLNNDVEVEEHFLEEMLFGIRRHKKAFSCAARMLQFYDREKLDNAGDYYNALGWAFARGKGKAWNAFEKEEQIFSSCAGAAIYRKAILQKTGLFDEDHFAYLEDLDLGYRARILGYENWYLPKAVVYHVGSGTSGSRYNAFKTRYSARNNLYVIYKNMPILQIILNIPFLLSGFALKTLFFMKKGLGKEYTEGLREGIKLCRKEKKVPFSLKNLSHYLQIQKELWINLYRRFC